MATWLSIGKLAQEFGVTSQTIRNWTKQGKLDAKRTLGGHRRYNTEEVDVKLGKAVQNRYTVTYARVSAADQREDLQRQNQELKQHCKQMGYEKTISLSEIGSGINYNKRALRKLLQWILSGQVERVVISYKDRLVRFGAEIIEQICKAMDVKLVVLNNKTTTSFQEELVQDVLTILTVFCSKIYGKRSHERKKKRQQNA